MTSRHIFDYHLAQAAAPSRHIGVGADGAAAKRGGAPGRRSKPQADASGAASSNDSKASDVQRRELGNRLYDRTKRSAAEWASGTARFVPTAADARALPRGSLLLRFEFTLAKPFTSKGESEFHHSEERPAGRGETVWSEIRNPIAREHVTGHPIVHGTNWKGHLRFAARMVGIPDPLIARLFGPDADAEGTGAGRLRFFPTFFESEPQREVVTPLERPRRTPARGPIDIEVMAPGSRGTFHLLYSPWPTGTDWHQGQIAEDLQAAARALRAMFLDCGFSAKKTVGWGVAKDPVRAGELTTCGSMWPAPSDAVPAAPFQPPADEFAPFMNERGAPKPELVGAGGNLLTNSAFKSMTDPPGSLSVYKRLRRWYDEHGAAYQRRLAGHDLPQAAPIVTYRFGSVTELAERMMTLADDIMRSGIDG